MPEISRFYGIVITMKYDENKPPHFHAEYGEYQALIGIEDFAFMKGNLPPKALGLIAEWYVLHKEDLLQDWALAEDDKPLFKIKPLY